MDKRLPPKQTYSFQKKSFIIIMNSSTIYLPKIFKKMEDCFELCTFSAKFFVPPMFCIFSCYNKIVCEVFLNIFLFNFQQKLPRVKGGKANLNGG